MWATNPPYCHQGPSIWVKHIIYLTTLLDRTRHRQALPGMEAYIIRIPSISSLISSFTIKTNTIESFKVNNKATIHTNTLSRTFSCCTGHRASHNQWRISLITYPNTYRIWVPWLIPIDHTSTHLTIMLIWINIMFTMHYSVLLLHFHRGSTIPIINITNWIQEGWYQNVIVKSWCKCSIAIIPVWPAYGKWWLVCFIMCTSIPVSRLRLVIN